MTAAVLAKTSTASPTFFKRAKCVMLTKAGEALYQKALELQTPWAREISEGLDIVAMEQAIEVVRTLRARLEAERKSGEAP